MLAKYLFKYFISISDDRSKIEELACPKRYLAAGDSDGWESLDTGRVIPVATALFTASRLVGSAKDQTDLHE